MKTRSFILVATLLLAFSSTITGSDCWYCNPEAGGHGYCDYVNGSHPDGRTQCAENAGYCQIYGDDCRYSSGGRGGGVCDPWDWYGCIELY